jgi:hypothetical protein
MATEIEVGRSLGEEIKDDTTKSGSYSIKMMTVGTFLSNVGVFSPAADETSFDQEVSTSFQRGAISTRSNPIKQGMIRDLLVGGSLPPLVVYERSDSSKKWEIIDGLQRTHAMTEAWRALKTIERGEQLPDCLRIQIESIEDKQQKLLTTGEFLKRPITVQVWQSLDADELVHLFMILNIGQQKVSLRHILEITHAHLRDMFREWGIQVLSEKDEKRTLRRGRRKSPEMMDIPSIKHFRFELLIDGLISYATQDPQIKTKNVLEDRESMNDRLSENVIVIGNESCRRDFKWMCLDLNRQINQKYADEPKWRGIIQTSDNFFIPLMAALGEVRNSMGPHFLFKEREAQLSEVLANRKDDDPLRFFTGAESLEQRLNEVTSNIGRRRRAIVFSAWQSFFKNGIYDLNYPLDWKGSASAQ